MAMPANEIEALIKAALPDATVTIDDLAGDGDHYAATVVSEQFRGLSRVRSTRSSMPRCAAAWAGSCMLLHCKPRPRTKQPDLALRPKTTRSFPPWPIPSSTASRPKSMRTR
jgi:hypothetical protein